MASPGYTVEALAGAAAIDPWALARQVTETSPDTVRGIGRSFGDRADQATEVARLAGAADFSTQHSYHDNDIPVFDAASSGRQSRHLLSDDGEQMTEVGAVFTTVADGLTEAANATRRHLQTLTDDVNDVVSRRNRFFDEYGRNLLPEDRDAAEQGFHAEAVAAVQRGASRIQGELDGFGDLLRSRTARLAELTDQPPSVAADSGGTDAFTAAGAAAGAVVNGLASVGNAIAHNPLEALAVVGGGALAAVSAAGVVASVGLDATGVGAVAGVPLGGLSALGVAAGVGIAGVAGASIINDAFGPDRVEIVDGGSEVEPGPEPSVLPVPERLRLVYDRMDALPAAETADEALDQLSRTLEEVEDEHSGVVADPNPGLAPDGRMYPPREDFIDRSPEGGITAVTRGNTIEISPDGALRIFSRRSGEIVYERPGAGG